MAIIFSHQQKKKFALFYVLKKIDCFIIVGGQNLLVYISSNNIYILAFKYIKTKVLNYSKRLM